MLFFTNVAKGHYRALRRPSIGMQGIDGSEDGGKMRPVRLMYRDSFRRSGQHHRCPGDAANKTKSQADMQENRQTERQQQRGAIAHA